MTSLTKDTLLAMCDYLIAKVCDDLENAGTWNSIGNGIIYDNNKLRENRRVGFYVIVKDDNGNEYGGEIDIPIRQCAATPEDLKICAKIATDRLNEVLLKEVERPYITNDLVGKCFGRG